MLCMCLSKSPFQLASDKLAFSHMRARIRQLSLKRIQSKSAKIRGFESFRLTDVSNLSSVSGQRVSPAVLGSHTCATHTLLIRAQLAKFLATFVSPKNKIAAAREKSQGSLLIICVSSPCSLSWVLKRPTCGRIPSTRALSLDPCWSPSFRYVTTP